MLRSKMLENFESARYAATPLMAILSADPSATIESILALPKAEIDALKNMAQTPIIQWDRARGLSAWTTTGQQALPAGATDMLNPFDALSAADKFPAGTIFFMHAMHSFIHEPDVQQAIWNLRDDFKANHRALVLLAPDLVLPPLLKQDVIVFNEPLPTNEDLGNIVKSIFTSARTSDSSIKEPSKRDLERAVDALCGLSAFPAEQVTAMSIGSKGLDFEMLWERKRQAISSTQGLSVWEGKEDFNSIGGYDYAIDFLKSILDNFSGIVLFDEVEKLTAGAGTDSSGSTTKQVGAVLTYSSNRDVCGILAMGIRGTGKTLLPKCAAKYAGIPLILMDLAAMEGGIVGETIANTNNAFKVLDAVSQVKPLLWWATTNNVEALSPELRRRFNLCTFFYDIPDAAERKSIWPIHLKAYELDAKMALPDDSDWTGSEIKSCCQLAKLTKKGLKDVASLVASPLQLSPDSVDFMRSLAHNRYVSATKGGLYQYSELKERQTEQARKLVRQIAIMPGTPKVGEA